MKKQYFLTATILLFMSFLTLNFSCKKSNKDHPDPDNNRTTTGLEEKKIDNTTLNLPVASGDVGLKVDVRDLARKGFKPDYVTIIIDGTLSSYSNNHLPINEYTDLAILKIKKDSLNAEEIKKAAEGLKVKIIVYDKDGSKLAETSESSLPINDKGKYYEVKTAKKAKKALTELHLDPDRPYVIQESNTTSSDGKFGVLTFDGDPSDDDPIHLKPYDQDNARQQEFYFIPVNKNTDDDLFYIRTGIKDPNNNENYVSLYYVERLNDPNAVRGTSDLPSHSSDFKIERTKDGWITIKPIDYSPLVENSDHEFDAGDGTSAAKFRIVPADIKWEATDLGTKFDQPILPAQKLEFGAHSQLINCSSAKLSQTIGTDKSETRTTTFGTSEEFQLTTTHEVDASATITLESEISAGVDFFGASASHSLSATAGYSYQHSTSETHGSTFESSSEETKSVSTERTVEVKPYTGVNVYDAIESYPHVEMPFIQSIRVTGEVNDKKISGEEVAGQLLQNQFGGVISKIGSDYVIITIRGTAEIDNFFDTQHNVEDIPDACSVN